jgi:integrase
VITKIDLRPYRNKPDVWEADITMLIQGQEVRRRWKSPMPSRTATERWAREKAIGFLANRAKPREEQKPQDQPKKEIQTFREFAPYFMSKHVVANRLRDTTAEDYQGDLDTHLLPFFGDLRLDQIDADKVQEWKADHTKGNKSSTVNKILARLKTMLRSAIEWKLLAAMPPIKRIKQPKLEKPHYRQHDDERFLAAASRMDLKLYVVCLLGDDAGLRHGEIIALHKSDIRFDDGPTGAIVVSRSSSKGKVTATKGNRCRRVPMTPRLRKALREFLPTVKGELVVLSRKGQPIRSEHPLRRWLAEVQDQLGLARGVHILRHTFATQSLHKGATLKEVQAFLGHTNMATTEAYIHTDSENLDQAMIKVARGRGAMVKPEPRRAKSRVSRTRRSSGETKAPARKSSPKRSKRP